MKISEEQVWAGSEASLKASLTAEEAAVQQMAAGLAPQKSGEEEAPRLLTTDGGLAVVAIKGPLNNEEGFWNELFGMTGYPEIRDALLAAAGDASTKVIVLDIDSGGGAVSGVSDVAQLIRTVNDHIKPVIAYTDGTMASAAYWLGSSAGEVHAGRTAMVGSIGVIATHMERSAALKEAGIGVTVVRAGKYKALANSVEPLTKEGRAQIQQAVDASYQVFVEHVAAMRGVSYAVADEKMAQGQEFIGEQAVSAGLIDSVTSFDAVISQVKAKFIDASNISIENRGKSPKPLQKQGATTSHGDNVMAKKALTEQEIAALAAGGTKIEANDAGAEQDEAGAAGGEADEAAGGEGGQTEGGETGSEGGEAAAGNPDISAQTYQFMVAQLATKDEALLQANIKIAKLEERAAETATTSEPLLTIARQSVNHMRVALGGTAVDLAAMNATALLAEHAQLSAQFQAKFKVGGVAAVSATASEKHEPQVSPRHMAQVNAVRHPGTRT